MDNTQNFTHLDYARYLAKFKTRRLAELTSMTIDDQEDLEQELILHILQCWPQFDPERGTVKTFISRVLDNKLRNILERQRTHKYRLDAHARSLNENIEISPGNTIERIETLDSDAVMLRSGIISRSTTEMHELNMDVEQVLSGLPPSLRRLCEMLKDRNVTEISQDTGVPRHEIYKSIRKLRAIFQSAGLDEYV